MNEAFSRLLSALPVDHRGAAADWDALGHTEIGVLLARLADVPQQREWHGEGDVRIHTKMVCDALAAMDDFWLLTLEQRQMMYLAALLHDAGKLVCTRVEDGRITSPHHGETGASMVRRLLIVGCGLGGNAQETALRESICLLVRFHMKPVHLLEGSEPELAIRRLAANGELAQGFTMRLLCMLAEADVLGRIADDTQELAENVRLCAALAQECGCYDGPYPFPTAHVQHAYLSGRRVLPDQPLYDDTWDRVIMVSALPGTGKDTWIARHCAGMPMLSLDELRRSMGVSPEDEQGSVAQAAKEQAKAYLRKHQSFVFNATNLSADLRGKWLRLFEQYGAATEIVYLETGWEERCRRNACRKYAVPEHAVEGMLDKLSPPERMEGTHVRWLCV